MERGVEVEDIARPVAREALRRPLAHAEGGGVVAAVEGTAAAAIPVQGDAQLVLDELAEIDPAADRVEVDGVAVGGGRGVARAPLGAILVMVIRLHPLVSGAASAPGAVATRGPLRRGRVAMGSRPGRLDVEAAARARGGAPRAPAPCQAFYDTPLYPTTVRGRPSSPGAGPPAEEHPARPRQPHPACFLVKRMRRSPRRLRPIGVRATRGTPGPVAGVAPPGGVAGRPAWCLSIRSRASASASATSASSRSLKVTPRFEGHQPRPSVSLVQIRTLRKGRPS